MSAPSAELPFERIGKYQIISKIGEGGMGSVYRARMHGPALATREVALKVINRQFAEQREFILMFLDEMRVAMGLSHRCVVQTFDAGHTDNLYFMVMELVEGSSLGGIIRRLPEGEFLPLDIALFIGMEICSALDYAHSFRSPVDGRQSPVVHRDVSPSNILVSMHGDVKLVDFGVARAAGRLQVSSGNQVKGKMAYMAPEQANGEAEPRSDIFALAAVLYLTLCGRPIRSLGTLEEVLGASPIPALLRTARPQISASLEELVMSCLSRQPSRRPSTAGLLRDALAREYQAALHERGEGPDPFERLRRYLADKLPGAAARAAPMDPQRLAQILLWQARDDALRTAPTASIPGEEGSLETKRSAPTVIEGKVLVDEELAAETVPVARARIPTDVDEPDPPGPTLPMPRVAEAGLLESRPHRSQPSVTAKVRHWAQALPVLIAVTAVLAAAALLIVLLPSPPRRHAPAAAAARADSAPAVKREPATTVAATPLDSGSHGQAAAAPDAARSADTTSVRRLVVPEPPRRPKRPAPRARAHAHSAKVWVMTRDRGMMVWADIYLDGKRVGQSPLQVGGLAAGEHQVEGGRPGFQPTRRKIVLAPGQGLRLFLDLKR